MTVGVAVMVFPFAKRSSDWINQTLIADLFIGPAANEIAGPTSFVSPATIDYSGKEPAVEAVDTYRASKCRFAIRRSRWPSCAEAIGAAFASFTGSKDTIMGAVLQPPVCADLGKFCAPFSRRGGRDAPAAYARGHSRVPYRRSFLRLHARPGHGFLERREFSQDFGMTIGSTASPST